MVLASAAERMGLIRLAGWESGDTEDTLGKVGSKHIVPISTV